MLIAFNKPFNVLCQFTDGAGRRTLADFVTVKSVYPAGRLDYDSEGLVLLTDDGALQKRIADPRNLTSGRTFLGPDHHPAYAGGGGNRSDGTPLVRRRSGALRTNGHTSSPPARPRRRPGQPFSTAPSGTRPASR